MALGLTNGYPFNRFIEIYLLMLLFIVMNGDALHPLRFRLNDRFIGYMLIFKRFLLLLRWIKRRLFGGWMLLLFDQNNLISLWFAFIGLHVLEFPSLLVCRWNTLCHPVV